MDSNSYDVFLTESSGKKYTVDGTGWFGFYSNTVGRIERQIIRFGYVRCGNEMYRSETSLIYFISTYSKNYYI